MPDQVKGLRVAISVTNCICYDQRVLKIAHSINMLGCDITIIGRFQGDCCLSDSVRFKTKRFRMIFKKGFLFYKFFNIRLFVHLLLNNYDLLVANDLDTLLPNFLVSKLKKTTIVYDSHEYFTGVPEIQNKPFVKWVWKTIERLAFPHLNYVITVNDSIATQYEKEYKIRPLTVRNIAVSSAGIRCYSREEMKIDSDHLLLIYQGSGINVDRGVEELVDAVSMTDKVTLIIAGSGDLLPELKERVMKLNLTGRIRFIPKVPWENLMMYTKSADAGLSLDKDTNLNYRFSLPNKLFDYISAGIAIIAGNLPEVSRIIEDNRCGVIIPSVTSGEICKAICALRDNRELLNELKRNAVIASDSLTWAKESEKIITFYSGILKNIQTCHN